MTILSLFDKTFGNVGDSILAGTMLRAQLEKDNLANKREMERLQAQQEGQASLLQTHLDATAAENEKNRTFEQEQLQQREQSALGRLVLEHNLGQSATDKNWQRAWDFIQKNTGVDLNGIDQDALDSFAGELAKITGMSPDDAMILHTNQDPQRMGQALRALPNDKYSRTITVGPNGPSATFTDKTPNNPKTIDELLVKKYQDDVSLYGETKAMQNLVENAQGIAMAKGEPKLQQQKLINDSRSQLAKDMTNLRLQNREDYLRFSKDMQNPLQLQDFASKQAGRIYQVFKGKMNSLAKTTYDPDTLATLQDDLNTEYQNQLAGLRNTLNASAAQFGGQFDANLNFVQNQMGNPGIAPPTPTTNEGWTSDDIQRQINAINASKKSKGKK